MGSWAGITDRGPVRPSHQDAFLAGAELVSTSTPEGKQSKNPLTPPLVAVCDGMGGHEHGELASRNTLTMLLSASENWAPRSVTVRDVERSIRSIHTKIFQMGLGRPLPMGTTLSGLYFRSKSQTCFLFHVGDTRVYRIRNGVIELLTEDHNRAYELGSALAGKNVLTSCIGGGLSNPRIDVSEHSVEPNDLFVLASDGLFEGADEAVALRNLLTLEAPDPDLLSQISTVVKQAAQKSRDNITLVAVRITEE